MMGPRRRHLRRPWFQALLSRTPATAWGHEEQISSLLVPIHSSRLQRWRDVEYHDVLLMMARIPQRSCRLAALTHASMSDLIWLSAVPPCCDMILFPSLARCVTGANAERDDRLQIAGKHTLSRSWTRTHLNRMSINAAHLHEARGTYTCVEPDRARLMVLAQLGVA
jgi:hypothetical protein